MTSDSFFLSIGNSPKPRGRLEGLLRAFLLLIISASLLGIVGGIFAFGHYAQDLPDFSSPEQYRPNLVTRVLSTDGRLIGEFGTERRRIVSYDRIPKRLVQAFIASEDGGFFEHDGIDFSGILKAVFDKVVHGSKLRGASTITQQLAKSLIVAQEGFKKGTERSLRRKIREAILARRLEGQLGKEDILYIYLNQVYLGHGAYGVQAAAENYFRKSVSELNLGECSLIAGLPQAPSRFSPFRNPHLARARQKYVLTRMVAEGFISQAEKDRALTLGVEETVHPRDNRFADTAPYFAEHVRRYIYDNYGEDMLYHQGLTIETTLDLERQWQAEDAMVRGLRKTDQRQGFRGPLAHLPPAQAKKFADYYEKKAIKGQPFTIGEQYVAVVTKTSALQAELLVGKTPALLHLGSMRWARKPNTAEWWEAHMINRVDRVLKPGDVVLVKPTKAKWIRADSHNWDIVKTLPKNDEIPLFTLQQIPLVQGALISIDPRTGYVQAMIGGYSFEGSEFNRAFQACRQPGSAFKPIVYGAAIKYAEYTPSTIIVDSPIVYDDVDAEKRWKPANYEMDFKGDVTARVALMNSMNIPALKTGLAVGVQQLREFAKHIGINTPLKEELGIAIGSSCVTPWELTSVYTTIQRLGKKFQPVFIKRIIDRDGNILENHTAPSDPWLNQDDRIDEVYAALQHREVRVMEAKKAHILRYLMSQVTAHGTGAAASALHRAVAGKTGTTNDAFDAWFLGFTPTLVTGTWVGFDNNLDGPLGVREQGGRTALPIWLKYMQTALKNVPKQSFTVPAGICNFYVDKVTGKRVSAKDPRAIIVPFECGTEPKREDDDKVVQPGVFFNGQSGY